MGLVAYEGSINKGALNLTMRMFEITKDGKITNIAVEDPDEAVDQTSVRFFELQGSRDAYVRRPICSGSCGNTSIFEYPCNIPVTQGTLIGMILYGPQNTNVNWGVAQE